MMLDMKPIWRQALDKWIIIKDKISEVWEGVGVLPVASAQLSAIILDKV